MAKSDRFNPGLPTTKVKAPRLPDGVVPRARLTQRLGKAMAYRLTLLIAPAGFGKTTLLSLWACENSLSTAWVSLDQTDNEPVRFWRSVISALQALQPSLGHNAASLLRTPVAVPLTDILTVLINDLASLDQEFAIVLDDYQHISAAAIHQALTYWVEHLPPRVHLLLASRGEPALPSLSRWRANGFVFQVAPDDLCFTVDETRAFLRNKNIQLKRREIALLVERTEGWIAGLQLAALSLQNQAQARRFIESFDGRNRYIGDYLADEVLRHQAPEVQQFLLGTAILNQLSAGLCNALLDRQDSQALLEALATTSVFLFPLDEERAWYRYHPLFADYLRARVERENPARAVALRHTASLWYEANGLAEEALAQALAIGEAERAAALLEALIPKVLWEQHEIFTVQRWLEALPEAAFASRAALLLAQAWLLMWSNRLEAAEQRIDQALHLPQAGRANRGEIAALRANLARSRGDAQGTLAFAQEALRQLDGEQWLLCGMMHSLIGGVMRWVGDIVAAQAAFDLADHHLQQSGSVHLRLHALGSRMQMQVQQGDFVRAEETFQQALTISTRTGQALPTLGMLYLAWGELLREQNEVDQADHFLSEGMALCQQWPGLVEARLDGYISLFRAALAKNAFSAAEDFLRQAEAEATRYGVAAWRARIALEVAGLRLLQGKLTEALRWQARLEAPEPAARDPRWYYLHHAECVMVARILVAQGKLSASVPLLKQLQAAAAAFGLIHGLVETTILEAQVLRQQGHAAQAAACLRAALSLARPHRYVRLFVEAGETSLVLLRGLAPLPAESGYLDLVLAASPARPAARESVTLTKREIEVLKLVARGQSNAEVAQELGVALGTVRRHLNNIYVKFNARSRTRSVARARELGLL